MTTLTYRTKPYPHQRDALKFLLRNRGGGLQVPMRWGLSARVGLELTSLRRCITLRTFVVFS